MDNPAILADFQAFPVPQDNLFAGKDLEVDSELILDAGMLTSIAAPLREMGKMVANHKWFVDFMTPQLKGRNIIWGAQNPPLDATLDDLKMLRDLGIRVMTLAYDGMNEFGCGFLDPTAPLTKKGQQLLRDMAEVGLVLDLSHAGHQTARDAIRLVQDENLEIRLVASHTGCYNVFRHRRNLPDDVLYEIAHMDGLIGLTTLTWLLDDQDNSLGPFRSHLEHLVMLASGGNTCIGSDGVYQYMSSEKQAKRLEVMNKMLDPDGTKFRARVPEESETLNTPRKLQVIREEIEDLMCLQGQVDLVMGGNFARFLSTLG